MAEKCNLHLFYGGPFSQWYPCTIVIQGETYNCAEQYMMAMKAKLFEDRRSFDRIMSTDRPETQKAIGRKVAGFDEAAWNAVCQEIVFQGNLAKFLQNKYLLDYLLDTEDDEIVEASPYDKIWGIGLGECDPRALDKNQWKGTNLLGEAIMRVRTVIRDYSDGPDHLLGIRKTQSGLLK